MSEKKDHPINASRLACIDYFICLGRTVIVWSSRLKQSIEAVDWSDRLKRSFIKPLVFKVHKSQRVLWNSLTPKLNDINSGWLRFKFPNMIRTVHFPACNIPKSMLLLLRLFDSNWYCSTHLAEKWMKNKRYFCENKGHLFRTTRVRLKHTK